MGSNFEKPRTKQESVFMYEMQHFVHNFPLTREQGLLKGKIAFFTFGHFVGSNFAKPRTRQESVLCTKCSISYILFR